MAKFRLKDAHPLMEKFNKLCAFADELGIKLNYGHYPHRIYLTEKDNPVGYELEDIEGSSVYEFPPTFNVRIIFEKEEDYDS